MFYEQIVDKLHSMGLTMKMSQERGKQCWPIPGVNQEIHLIKLKPNDKFVFGWGIDLRLTGPRILSQISSIPYPADKGLKQIQQIIMDRVDPPHPIGGNGMWEQIKIRYPYKPFNLVP